MHTYAYRKSKVYKYAKNNFDILFYIQKYKILIICMEYGYGDKVTNI